MERDIKRAKGPDELPMGTRKDSILGDARIDLLEEELRSKEAIIARLTKENEELQQKLGLLSRAPVKKGAQTRYWRKEEHERFLEALEKYGQRDVKNISAYVGTRSPTQVRTHAQKYFLKQRREETAQLKNANTMARKRRLSSIAGGGGTGAEEEEDEEDEEDEENEEDEEDSDNGEGRKLNGNNAMNTDEVSHGSGDQIELSTGRRKSMRVTNAAVIKLRAQDLVAHSQTRASGKRGAASNGTATNGGSYGSAAMSSSSGTTAATNTTSMNPVKSEAASASSRKSSSNSPAGSGAVAGGKAFSGMSAYNIGIPGSVGAASVALSGGPGTSGSGGAGGRAGVPPPSLSASSTGGAAPMNPATSIAAAAYMHPPYASAAYGAGYTPFRTDIFASPEEATLFYKAIKTYERETDRAKVLVSIKEYFLPHRSVEEISNMVDLAFPPFDPAAAASYNAQAAAAAAAAAAAFHPMYTQTRMYYPDTTAHTSMLGPNGGLPTGALAPPRQSMASMNTAASGLSNMVTLDPKMGYLTANHGGAPSTALPSYTATAAASAPMTTGNSSGFGMDSSDVDFIAGQPTHIDSSSLASISDQMSEHMGGDKIDDGTEHSSQNTSPSVASAAMSGSSRGVAKNASGQAVPSAPTSNATTSAATANMNSAANMSMSSTSGNGFTSNHPVSQTSTSSTKSANSGSVKKEDEDDLMNELASLTSDRTSAASAGLSSFLGGRPLSLSPGVFGSGTTPLSFGMTPLMANTTPLSFMSPLGLNFSSQSPINPYFNPQK